MRLLIFFLAAMLAAGPAAAQGNGLGAAGTVCTIQKRMDCSTAGCLDVWPTYWVVGSAPRRQQDGRGWVSVDFTASTVDYCSISRQCETFSAEIVLREGILPSLPIYTIHIPKQLAVRIDIGAGGAFQSVAVGILGEISLSFGHCSPPPRP